MNEVELEKQKQKSIKSKWGIKNWIYDIYQTKSKSMQIIKYFNRFNIKCNKSNKNR